jgi:hypothetical protein
MGSASPFWLHDRGEGVRRAWQIGDLVTAAPHRGKGYFGKCLAALCDGIPHGDILVCYPNARSIRELSRQEFMPVAELKYRARPAWWWRAAAAEPIAADEPGGAREFTFKGDATTARGADFHVVRDAAYLHWRYIACPGRNYVILLDGRADAPNGLIVARRFQAGGLPVAVVMDAHGTPEAIARLFARLDRYCRATRLAAILTLATDLPVGRRGSAGLLSVPKFLQPKHMVCVARRAGIGQDGAMSELARPWHLQAGDWDGL